MGGTHLHTPQSIFQHTMTQNTSPQNELQWLGMPQIPPMRISWSTPSFQQPDLVRFTGEGPVSTFGPVMHQKRKLETPDIVDLKPSKQFITEEKMAQHFQGLHISPNAVRSQAPELSIPSNNSNSQILGQSSNQSLDLPDLVETNKNNFEPRLVISEELKRLQQEPILPSSLLSKLERPSMALVLWEPPSRHLSILPTSRDASRFISSSTDSNNNGSNNNSSTSSNNNGDNNNESIPNLNQVMDMDEISDSALEPMDL